MSTPTHSTIRSILHLSLLIANNPITFESILHSIDYSIVYY